MLKFIYGRGWNHDTQTVNSNYFLYLGLDYYTISPIDLNGESLIHISFVKTDGSSCGLNIRDISGGVLIS